MTRKVWAIKDANKMNFPLVFIYTGQRLMGWFLIESMLYKHCSNAILTSEFNLEQFYYFKLDMLS